VAKIAAENGHSEQRQDGKASSRVERLSIKSHFVTQFELGAGAGPSRRGTPIPDALVCDLPTRRLIAEQRHSLLLGGTGKFASRRRGKARSCTLVGRG
jgi:hypothetical protein